MMKANARKRTPPAFTGAALITLWFVMVCPAYTYAKIFPNADYVNWNHDVDHNRIDDRLESKMPLDTIDAAVLFSRCLTPGDVDFVGAIADIEYVGEYVQGVWVKDVSVGALLSLLDDQFYGPDIFRIELCEVGEFYLDNSCRAIRARDSDPYSPNTAWDQRFTGKDKVIAILDSGVDDGHPAFEGKLVGYFDAEANTATNPDDALYLIWHGTHVACIALGVDPNGTYIGVARDASLVDVKVGTSRPESAYHQRAIAWCINNKATYGINVLNLSYGVGGPCNGKCKDCMAVDAAVDRGLVVCVATGNDYGLGWMPSPAAADRAITVGALDDLETIWRTDDDYAAYSNSGKRTTDGDDDPIDEQKPDVVAPGGADGVGTIMSAMGKHPGQDPPNQYHELSGTSMACPHVAGMAAILLEAEPDLSPDDIKAILRRTSTDKAQNANPAYTVRWGKGEIDGFNATWSGPPADLYINSWIQEIYSDHGPQPPPGVTTDLHAIVHNNGPNDANNVDVLFFTNRNNVGYDGWTQIGQAVVNVLNGGVSIATIPWTPLEGHQCIRARTVYMGDPVIANNRGQENFDPRPVSSVSEFSVEAGAPFPAPYMFRLNVNALDLLAEEGWTAEVFPEEQGLFDPLWIDTAEVFDVEFPIEDDFCPRIIRVNINPPLPYPAAPPARESSTLILQGWVGSVMVGQQTLMSYLPPSPTTIHIEKTHNMHQGHYAYISITLDGETLKMGGFDFLIAYDASALTFLEATPGQLLEDCGWEYFTYRHGWQGNCEGPCPSGLLRIVAIADINNGPNHPSCFGPPDTDPHQLAKIKFYVTNDRTYSCQFVPVRFFWHDCGDNTISSVTGDTLWLSQHVYDFEGNEVTGAIHYGGHWWLDGPPYPVMVPNDACQNDDPEKPDAIPFVNFIHGGIDIACAESIDVRGDINLNGVENEIADAVLFTNYFLYGIAVFHIAMEGQIAATDVNNDGLVLSVGDLVYLIRIITGDALPFTKLAPFAQSATVGLAVSHSAVAVSTNSQTDIGAGYFLFEHAGYELGEPYLVNGATSMTLKYHDEEGVLKLLVYSMEKDRKIAAGAENVFVIPITGEGTIELTETQLSDYYGNMLTSTVDKHPVLPKAFALHQNYPNPFNATTVIGYELPTATEVEISIYNLLGQKVITLLDEYVDAGSYIVEWDGVDQSGNNVSSGVYFYRLHTPQYSSERKMVLLR